MKSLILETLTFPFWTAASMEAMRLVVVVEYGTSRITSFCTPLTFSMRARTLTLPAPSSYSPTSIRPPWGKSGYREIFSPLRMETSASSSSMKLWGRMVVDMPTAIPSAPSIRSTGTLAGSSFGLLAAAVVAGGVLREGRVEERLQGKRREPALDVAGGGGRVPGDDVAEVPLLAR